jgi:16S rRNA (cytosine967-C5)-methyltransferase
MPDWIAALMVADLGEGAESVMIALRDRAPVFLRVNSRRGSVPAAIEALAGDSIVAVPHLNVKSALQVVENERRIKNSDVYLDGRVELQDAASQAAVLALPLANGMRVLDFCAGGGGKTLAMAAVADLAVFAHDALPRRMADLQARADRAGCEVTVLDTADAHTAEPFDLVLVDAPCSGSGTWRRDPDAKWRLTPEDLAERIALQAEILDQASGCVAQGGALAYATCSVIAGENDAQIDGFLARHQGWSEERRAQWRPGPDGDGFFLAVLRRG